MAGFDRIPDEILLDIVSHLGSIRDLAALSAQCRRFYACIDMPTRQRFHRIRLRRVSSTQARSIAKKLLEILKEPKLGLYVRQLELNSPPSFAEPVEPLERTENGIAELFMAAMGTVGFPDSKVLRILVKKFLQEGELGEFKVPRRGERTGTRLAAGFGEVTAVLLISLCPNIEILKITDVPWPVRELLERINSKDFISDSLQKLREIRVFIEPFDKERYNQFCLPETMRYFHRLPSIESIRIKFACFDYEGTFSRVAPKASNISKIFIDHSETSSHELATIIRHPKALKEFRFGVGGRAVMDGSDCSIQPKLLGRAFQSQKSSLQVLDLDLDSIINRRGGWIDGEPGEPGEQQTESEPISDDENFDSDFEDASIATPYCEMAVDKSQKFGTTIGSFHDFAALTHISVGAKLLLGHEEDQRFEGSWADIIPPKHYLVNRLPPNLEYLCIRGFNKDEDVYFGKMIFEMMEMRAERLPSLKEVRGVDEYIPNSESVENPDEDVHLICEDTDSWASGSESDRDDDDNGNVNEEDDGEEDYSRAELLRVFPGTLS